MLSIESQWNFNNEQFIHCTSWRFYNKLRADISLILNSPLDILFFNVIDCHNSYQFIFVFQHLGPVPVNCTFHRGDGIGGKEEYIGKEPSAKACAQECTKRKETDESINGATYSTTGTKKCYCEKGMSKRNDNKVWRSCFFKSCKSIIILRETLELLNSYSHFFDKQHFKQPTRASNKDVKWLRHIGVICLFNCFEQLNIISSNAPTQGVF